MLITYKDLLKVRFPIFVLPSDNWHISDGVLFLEHFVLDEKNMPGKSLGVRRLQCCRQDLLPLKKAILNIPELLRSPKKFFIDSDGKPFIYQKTKSSKLKSYRIRKIEKKETASLLWLYGVSYPITIDRPPLDEFKWVRMLHIDGAPWLIYDYGRLETKTTYRKV